MIWINAAVAVLVFVVALFSLHTAINYRAWRSGVMAVICGGFAGANVMVVVQAVVR